MSVRRWLLFAALSLIGLGMLTGIAAALFPGQWIPDQVVATIFITATYTLGALVAVTVARTMRRLLLACLITAGLSWAGVTTAVWLDGVVDWSVTDWMFRISVPLIFPALAMVHRMILGPLKPRSLIGRVNLRVALISAPIAAVMLMVPFVWDTWWGNDAIVVRMMSVASIFAVGSSVAAGVVWFFDRRPEHDDPGLLGEGVPVELPCPRCGTVIRGRSNRDCRCGSCRLRVRVEVEEPRCGCGYLLYQLAGETCPECGTPVPEADRWAALSA